MSRKAGGAAESPRRREARAAGAAPPPPPSSRPPPASSLAAAPPPPSLGEGVDRLLALVAARSAGRAGDDDVEKAVSELLGGGRGGGGPGGGRAPPPPRAVPAPPARALVRDEANYDDDDDDDGGGSKGRGEASRSSRSAGRRGRGISPRTKRASAAAKAKARARASSTEAAMARVAALRKRIASPPVAAPPPPKRARGRRRKKKAANAERAEEADGLDEEHWEKLDSIPLGRQGARMMVTFGDGRRPKLEAVEAALLGTRRCLQSAVRDARALRRRDRETYLRARKEAVAHYSRPGGEPRPSPAEAAAADSGARRPDDDARIRFRALAGYDSLGRDLPAGFDVSQLEVIFPEEMQAYKRWKAMQRAYAKKSGDEEEGMADEDKSSVGEEKEEEEEDEEEIDSNGQVAESPAAAGSAGRTKDAWVGGHLASRLAQFDARTSRMREQWYLTFSEVRQGSFLGRSARESQSWNRMRRKTQGRHIGSAGTWEDLAAPSVRFLHWIGFDPMSALPPPDEESAQALAFLGHNFLGKIVERAILLRRMADQEECNMDDAVKKTRRGKQSTKEGDGDDSILEMQPGEQLNPEDIERALHDSTIIPEPLYCTANSTGADSKPQLYFGSGFEDRLEVELDEIVLGKKHAEELSEKERKIRCDEDELFSSLQRPPSKLGGIVGVLGEDHRKEGGKAEKPGTTQKGSQAL